MLSLLKKKISNGAKEGREQNIEQQEKNRTRNEGGGSKTANVSFTFAGRRIEDFGVEVN